MTMYIVIMPVRRNVMGGRHGFEIPLCARGGAWSWLKVTNQKAEWGLID